MRHPGRHILIVAIALILGIGQACACLSHGDGAPASEPVDHAASLHAVSHQSEHGEHAHAENAPHQDHDDHPGGGDCPHCTDSLVMAMQAETGASILPIPPAQAMLANDIDRYDPGVAPIPRLFRVLNWHGPPGETPVSLKTVMRD